MREGGEQPEENDQSATQVNSIRPSLSGSLLGMCEPLTARRANPLILWISPGDRRGKLRRCSNGLKRSWRNGKTVVGGGMVGSSNEISRENCRWPGREPSARGQFREYWEKKPRPQVVHSGPAERNRRCAPRVRATIRSSQSPHNSDEAGQHKPVEPRRTGR